MKTRKFQPVLIFFMTAVVVALAFISSAALAQSNDEVVSSGIISRLAGQETVAYWTGERMRNAVPMPFPKVSKAAGLRAPGPTLEAPSGPMVIANSGRPGDVPREQRIEVTEGLTEPLFGTYPFSFTRYRLFPDRNDMLMYITFPYKETGKLFFTIPTQGDFVCSASSVNSANNSVVWTAGHCVYSPDLKVYHTNFVFVPGRFIGINPFGTWTPKTVMTTVGWTSGLLEYDHGALVMNLGGVAPAAKIGDRIGFLGFLANASRQQHWHVHGYPGAPRDLGTTPPGAQFDGEHHEICAAAWATDDQPTGTPGVDPPTIGIGCDQTGGTSGGPWVIDFSGVGESTNLLNGNNSYRYTGPNPPENLKMFSPYFGNGAVHLRNEAQAVPVP